MFFAIFVSQCIADTLWLQQLISSDVNWYILGQKWHIFARCTFYVTYTFFPHSKSFLRGLFTLIEFIRNCVDLIQTIIRSVCIKYTPTVLNCIWICDIWGSLSGEYEDYDQVGCVTVQYDRYLYTKLHGFLPDPVQWFQKMEHDRWGNIHMHSLCGENVRHGHRVSGQYFVLDITGLCKAWRVCCIPCWQFLKCSLQSFMNFPDVMKCPSLQCQLVFQ